MASSSSPGLNPSEPTAAEIAERYRCGSLQYTKASLVVLFGWMIWGNICFNLFEGQGGYTILNLYLQDNFHVSNLTVNILFNVIPMILGTIMTPIISFKSDRTRTRMGRRIPYILYTAPFLAAFAALIGFSDDIIRYCKIVFPENGYFTPFAIALFLIGIVTVGYSFFNEFVGTVYYYLLPDVMPRHFIGRFQGVSGMFGTATGILVNMYIVPYQLTHIKTIHVGLAILYVVGFGLVCLFVKEGKYPPVEDVTEKTRFFDQAKLYFRECFTHPIFIMLYISTAFSVLNRGLAPAGIFHLHLSSHQAKLEADIRPKIPVADNTATTTEKKLQLAMAMTPNGKLTISSRNEGAISIWNSTAKKPVLDKTIKTKDSGITVLAITSDGKSAFCGSQAGTIEVFDIATGQSSRQLTAHAGGVHGLAVSGDGKFLASAGGDKTVKIWDVAEGTCLQTLVGHEDQVNCVSFSSDAGRVVSGGSDKKLIIWDVLQGTKLQTLEGSTGPIYAACFAPAQGPVPKHEMPARNWAMAQFDKAGFFLKQVFTNESLYDVPADQTSKLLAQDGWVISGGRDGAKEIENSRVRIWDLAEGKEIQALKGHKGAITSVVYKADLRVILSGSVDGSVRLWKPWSISGTASDQSYKTMSGYTRGITSMGVTEGDTKLINASVDGSLHVWNINQGVSLAKGGLRGIFMSIIAFILIYPIGSLVDRWNPLRTFLVCTFITLPFPILSYLWYHNYTFGLYMGLLQWPFATLAAMCTVPMMIILYPKSKYGQFSSANAMVRQAVGAIAGPLGAILMDYLTVNSLETDYYRYGFLFNFAVHGMSLAAMMGVYFYWKKLGGENYVAPET